MLFPTSGGKTVRLRDGLGRCGPDLEWVLVQHLLCVLRVLRGFPDSWETNRRERGGLVPTEVLRRFPDTWETNRRGPRGFGFAEVRDASSAGGYFEFETLAASLLIRESEAR
jgi:hypothetical protein